MSRRSARNRHRAAPARQSRPPAGTVTLSGDQLTAILAGTQRASGNLAVPLPRPPQWAADAFPPGIPLRPQPVNQVRPQTGRADPRLFELPLSTNINISTAPYVPWRVLEEASNMPLFRKCIERRKGVCQLDFVVTVDPKAVAREATISGQAEKDVEKALREKYTPEISRISDWFQNPDRQNNMDWGMWTSALMENRLTFDATAVWPKYSYGGDLLALWVLDGSTIKPLLDEYGARPAAPYPAFQQILWGYPRAEFRGEFTATQAADGSVPGWSSDDLLYERTIYRPKTPYGMSATEIALMDGILWMRRMGWLIAEYTEGVSGAILETSEAVDWDMMQWEDWSRALNDHLGGNTAERLKYRLFPPGTRAVLPEEVAERYKPEMDMFLVKLVAGDFGLTATELGFPEVGSLGASFHEGEEDVLNRTTRRPDANWIGNIASKLAVRHLGMPPALQIQILGLESEDEAAADAVALSQIQSGRMTLNEDRARRGESAYNFAEADMPQLQTGRGVVFMEGAAAQGPPGTLIGPAMAAPGLPPAAPGADTQPGGTPPPDGPHAKPEPAPAAKGSSENEPPPGTAALEVAAYRRWVRKGRQRGTFTCQVITKAAAPATAPDMAADAAVVFKDGPGKAAATRSGLAGSGTRRL